MNNKNQIQPNPEIRIKLSCYPDQNANFELRYYCSLLESWCLCGPSAVMLFGPFIKKPKGPKNKDNNPRLAVISEFVGLEPPCFHGLSIVEACHFLRIHHLVVFGERSKRQEKVPPRTYTDNILCTSCSAPCVLVVKLKCGFFHTGRTRQASRSRDGLGYTSAWDQRLWGSSL